MPQTPAAVPPRRRPGARHIELRLQLLDSGRIRVSTPQARGWAVCVRGPMQLWHAVRAAFREATVAGYAMWRGERYDQDLLTDATDPTEPERRRMPDADELAERASRRVSYSKDAVTRPDVANPGSWTPNPDGTWSAPQSAKSWRADTPHVQKVLAKRARMGLSTSYAEYMGDADAVEVTG